MKKYFIFFALSLLFIFRFLTTRPIYKNGQKLKISAKVLQEPIRYSNYQSLSLAGFKISLPLFPEIHYGDNVVIEGFVNNKQLLKTVLLEVKETTGIFYQLRKRIIDFFQKSLPEPHSSLMAGIVLGSKSNLPEDFWEALKKTGTAHVVVASGMNVSMVAGFLISILVLFFKRRQAIIFALIGIWLYVAISGFEAPIIRAAIMGSLTFTAQKVGRLSESWRILFVSAFIMLIARPDWIGDLGFLLSFVATASIMLFQNKIGRFLKVVPQALRESFSTSLAAQIGVTPIIFVTFGQFNILSSFINLLVLWTVAPIMIIGAVSGLIGLIFLPLGKLVLFLSFPLTTWFIKIVKLFG